MGGGRRGREGEGIEGSGVRVKVRVGWERVRGLCKRKSLRKSRELCLSPVRRWEGGIYKGLGEGRILLFDERVCWRCDPAWGRDEEWGYIRVMGGGVGRGGGTTGRTEKTRARLPLVSLVGDIQPCLWRRWG